MCALLWQVHALLEKLKPEMITLDPDQIGNMDRADQTVLEKEKAEAQAERDAGKKDKKPRKRARGRSTSVKRFLNKQSNVRDEKREKILIEMKKKKEAKEEAAKAAEDNRTIPTALGRFKT